MATNHEDTALASSFTDLMTSLTVIFILLLVAMWNNAQQQTEGTKSQVLRRLQEALRIFRDQGVQVVTDPKDPLGLLVLVPLDLLKFRQGRSEIPTNGRKFLIGFTPKLVSTACSSEHRAGISSIVVEGHASSEGDEKNNLQLSQRRSMEVVNESLNVLSSLNDRDEYPSGLYDCFLKFVSAVGRGSAELVLTSGKEDRERSRRVVFKIRVRSSDQFQLKEQISLTSSDKIANGP